MAASFLPNSKGLGLEEIGVKISERGFIEIDERMATNVPGVWAIGDVTGKLMLAHVGMSQGIVCAETYRRRADRDPQLPEYAQSNLLPAADRLLRDDRGAGQRSRI